jgi:mannosyltransferase
MAVVPVPAVIEPSALAPRQTLTRPLRRSIFLLFSIIFMVGVALRFYHLSYLSLWSDETFSRFYYKIGLSFMWTDGLRSESSPPLYYMALGAWIRLFGASETALRSLSAAASSIAIVLVYGLAAELFDRKHGLLAAALFAVSATEIYYAQEARPYALLLIPLLVMLLACARCMRGPANHVDLAVYVVAATVSIYTHTTMFLLVASCGIVGLACLWQSRGTFGKRVVLGWVGANGCVGVLALPALIGMTNDAQLRQLAWIPPIDLHQIGAVASNTLAGTLTPGRFPGGIVAIMLTGVLAASIWRDAPERRTAVIALAIPGLYAALVVLVSVTVQPILLSRIFCWIGAPLCLIQARAMLARGRLRPVAIGAILGAAAIGLYYQFSVDAEAKEPWRESILAADTGLKQAELVVLAPNTDPSAVMYYAPGLTHVAMWSGEPLTPSELGIMPRLFGIPGITVDEIAHPINAGSQVVLIAKAADEEVLPRLLRQVRSPESRIDHRCIGGDGRPTGYPCGIAILCWRPSSGAAEQRFTPDAAATF